MLTYTFENIGKDSLYEHLYKSIKSDILNRTLNADFKLPSKRNFAKNLGISTITVENAYAQLMAEGYIYSIPKKGYYVSDISNYPFHKLTDNITDSDNQNLKPQLSNDYTNDYFNQNKHSPQQNQTSEYIADFTSNKTNTSKFPFYTWAKLVKEVIADKSDELLITSPSGGVYELRLAISRHLKDFRGMDVAPEQIIVGAGTEYLYSLLIQLLGRDKVFAVEDPGYHKIRQIYESNNVECISIPMDNLGINPDILNSSKADIVHLSLSHHYPTGIVTPVSRRYELLKWAADNPDKYIIEDDYDCEFRLLGKPIPSLQSIDEDEKVIYMNTFTKTLTSTIRISYMILPAKLLKKFNERLGFYSCTVSNFEQYTLAKFINDGLFEKHINRMRIFYRNQRDILIDAINNSPLSKLVDIEEQNSGLHFLLKVNTQLSDEELIEKARKNGLKITCLSEYYYNRQNKISHKLVINYSSINKQAIDDAIACLYKCLT